jgi:hypothetical protein
VWLFSNAARDGRGASELLEAAEHGYRFLCDHMWDHRHQGFFWEIKTSVSRKIAAIWHSAGIARYNRSRKMNVPREPTCHDFRPFSCHTALQHEATPRSEHG